MQQTHLCDDADCLQALLKKREVTLADFLQTDDIRLLLGEKIFDPHEVFGALDVNASYF
jgi:hypothetical protein